MTINCPNNFIEERRYILDVMLGEFLGLDYQLNPTSTNTTNLVLKNGHQLCISDAGFQKLQNERYYLDQINIPRTVSFVKNQFTVEADIPILYGNEKLECRSDKIDCGIDLFAGSFFMLSRWEEKANSTRDEHERFPAEASLAFQNNFLHRPIVNEYLEMLWAMLTYLGCTQKRKTYTYQPLISHDVDMTRMWKSMPNFIKTIAGDVLKRKDGQMAIGNFKSYFNTKVRKQKDPYDTYDYLMDLSESIGQKSHFFFMAGGLTSFDNRYDIEEKYSRELMTHIDRRGHIIGIHPSYDAYNNPVQFKREVDLLRKLSPQKLYCGRQHYLRFEVPTTWQLWEDNGLEWEATLSYADKEGFRCGVCYPFPVFNVEKRKSLELVERPLVVMDGSYMHYQKASPEDMIREISQLVAKIKKYNGEFVFLWHNSAFNNLIYKEYAQVYEQVIGLAKP